jgi:hypothetical protein
LPQNVDKLEEKIEDTYSNPDPSSILIKECPGRGCSAKTSKGSGCNHITYPVCREHWCFECIKAFGKKIFQ